jgi:hypothetical protein
MNAPDLGGGAFKVAVTWAIKGVLGVAGVVVGAERAAEQRLPVTMASATTQSRVSPRPPEATSVRFESKFRDTGQYIEGGLVSRGFGATPVSLVGLDWLRQTEGVAGLPAPVNGLIRWRSATGHPF